MRGIIVKLLNCFIVNHPFCSPPYKGGVRGGSNLAIEQFNNCKYPKGFTLIELLVVVAVLGILAGGILIALNIGGTIDKASLVKAKKFAASLENGLAVNQMGKWSFSESINPTPDTSGYGNNATLNCFGVGCVLPTWQDASACTLGLGGCLKFSGTQYIEANSAFGDVDFKTQPFTIGLWVNPSSLAFGIDYSLIHLGTPSSNSKFAVQLLISGERATPRPVFVAWFRADGDSSGRKGIYSTEQASLPINKWSYLAVTFTYNGTDPGITNSKIYVNGKSVPISTIEGTWAGETTNVVRIGRAMGGNPYHFVGLIDEVAIYNQPLTLSQIQHLHAQGVLKRAMVSSL